MRIVKPGEEAGQGVGYLEDGTMVVIEGGRDHVGAERRRHGHQRAANQRRPHGLRPLRTHSKQYVKPARMNGLEARSDSS